MLTRMLLSAKHNPEDIINDPAVAFVVGFGRFGIALRWRVIASKDSDHFHS